MTNLLEKPCRSKRRRKLRGNPLQKRTNTKTVIIPIGQRKWTDIETQESNDPCCFQVPKFITRLLRHRQGVQREADGAVHYDQVIDECQKSNSTIMNIGLLTERRNSSMPHIGPLLNRYLFWQKVEDKRKVSILFETEQSSEILVPSSNPRKDIQEVQSILHCKTMYCYQKMLPSIFITSETEKNCGQ